jgi:hypothetical protein
VYRNQGLKRGSSERADADADANSSWSGDEGKVTCINRLRTVKEVGKIEENHTYTFQLYVYFSFFFFIFRHFF